MTKKIAPSPAEAQKAANEALQSFTPTTDFVGFPFGKEHPVHFRAGLPSTPVPAAYIASLSDKKTAADHG